MSILNIILRATDQASNVIRSVEGNIQSIAKSGASLQNVGSGITSVGKAVTLGVTVPIVGLGAVVAKTAIEFEDQMSKVKAISGATGADFKALQDQARLIGSTTIFSATEAAKGMTFLAQSGWSAKEIIASLPSIMTMASAGGIDLASATDIAANTMTSFGMKASEAGHFADVMAMAANKTNTDIAMLGESFKYVAPLASVMSISLEQTAAMLGIMANNGIKASQGGTTLRMALADMAKPSKHAQAMLNAYGISLRDANNNMLPMPQILDNLNNGFSKMSESQQVAAMKMLVGAEAMTGMLVLVKAGSGKLNEVTQSFKNSNGAASDMAKTMQDNTAGSIRSMNASLNSLAITLGNTLAPTITNLAKTITDLANSFAQLDPATQQTIINALAIAAAIGPVVMVIGSLVKGIGLLWKVLTGLVTVIEAVAIFFGIMSIEVIAVIAIVGGLIYLFIEAAKHWDETVAFYQGTWDAIAGWFKGIWQSISDGFGKAIGWIGEKINSFKSFFVQMFQGAADLVLSPFRAVAEGVNSVIDSINTISVDVPDWVPFIGGQKLGFSIPHIPKFHTGGVFRAATAGGEGLAMLKDGEYVSNKRPSSSESDGRIGTFTVQNNIGGSRVSSTLVDVFGKGMVSGIKLRTGVTS